MQIRALKLLGIFSLSLIVLVGCFKGEQSNINSLNDVNNRDQQENEGINGENTNSQNDMDNNLNDAVNEETAKRDLYLLDVNKMVVAQSFDLPVPQSREVATQVLQYLVIGGPVTELLPSGFQAVLPEGTEVLGVNLQEDGSIIVDFSEEFTNYRAEDESKILQAITYTLTQFESIDRVFLRINGHPLTEMPINGTPIGEGYSRANGINYFLTDTIDFIASESVTLYYPAEYNDNRYYVPITQHIKINDDYFSQIVAALIEGPGYEPNVIDVFNTNTTLLEQPKLEKGVLELVFNESILKDVKQGIIADEVVETLTRTLTEFSTVNAILVKVENVNVIMNEKGEEYLEPVTIEKFLKGEKL